MAPLDRGEVLAAQRQGGKWPHHLTRNGLPPKSETGQFATAQNACKCAACGTPHDEASVILVAPQSKGRGSTPTPRSATPDGPLLPSGGCMIFCDQSCLSALMLAKRTLERQVRKKGIVFRYCQESTQWLVWDDYEALCLDQTETNETCVNVGMRTDDLHLCGQCRKTIAVGDACFRHKGSSYYFCNLGCARMYKREHFKARKNPSRPTGEACCWDADSNRHVTWRVNGQLIPKIIQYPLPDLLELIKDLMASGKKFHPIHPVFVADKGTQVGASADEQATEFEDKDEECTPDEEEEERPVSVVHGVDRGIQVDSMDDVLQEATEREKRLFMAAFRPAPNKRKKP